MQKKFYQKLLLLILGMLTVGIVNSFLGLLNEFTLALFFLLIFTAVYFIYNLPKTTPEYYQMTFNVIVMFALIYFMLTYFAGLFLGFLHNVTSVTIKNIAPVVISVVAAEFIRYILIDKARRKRWIISLITAVFVILNLTLITPLIKFSDPSETMKFIFIFLLPAISSNVLLTYVAQKGNLKGNIAYRLIMEVLPKYLLPISPDLGLYMTGVLGISVPILLVFLVFKITRVERDEITDRHHKIIIDTVTGTVVIVTIVIVGVFSGWFKYQFLAIATDSMAPQINRGDAVIIEKLNAAEQKSLKEGEILIFQKENTIIVHRIVDIENFGDVQREYKTKGDANEFADSFKIQTSSVIGRAGFKIPYFGWPTVWLNEKFTHRE